MTPPPEPSDRQAKGRPAVDAIMSKLGVDVLVSSTENAPDSVWVTDDLAPGGVAGYYTKQHEPLPHKWLFDGRVAVLDFEHDNVRYRIRCGQKLSAAQNERAVADVFLTVLAWIEMGIVTWKEGFAGFRRDAQDAWWRVLRAPPDATREEIEAAFKRQVGKVHPDHGGTHEAFLQLRAAYEEALSCA